MDFKTGKEIVLHPIKLKERGFEREIDELQTEINGILFFYYTLKINPLTKNFLLNELKRIGESVKDVESKGKRKEELLGVLRNYYRILNQYVPQTDRNSILDNDKRVSKYLVSRYLTEKDKFGRDATPSEDFCFNWLKKIRKFVKTYVPSRSLLKTYKELAGYIELNIETSD